MANRRFEENYKVKNRDNLGDPEYWNRRFEDIDRRLTAGESSFETIDHLPDRIEGLALDRLNLVMGPALEKIGIASEQGFLMSDSDSSVSLVEDTQVTFVIPDPERFSFAPSPYITINRKANNTDYAFGHTVSYSKATGVLVVELVGVWGNPGPFSDWSIFAGTALVQSAIDIRDAIEARFDDAVVATDEVLEAKDIVVASAAQVASDKSDVIIAKNATAALAAAAQGYADSITPSLLLSKSEFDGRGVRFDTAQSLSGPQKTQARANVGLVIGTDVLSPTGNGSGLTGIQPFPSGTNLLFQQTSAPPGWTKQTTHNDKALRVVSGSASSGGSNSFSTVMAQTAVGNKTLSESEIASHPHYVRIVNAEAITNEYEGLGTNAFYSPSTGTGRAIYANTITTYAGGGGAHNHTLTMSMQYVDIIIATKD